MSTPHPHRGLPVQLPPMAPAPPQTPQGPPQMTSIPGQVPGQLPPAPAEWRNAEESMRIWLQTKAEEEKRKQEEEKSKQESYRLEQRRIEQTMLHESLDRGIPAYMVPMVFAGMSGGNLPNQSLEWAQHYMAQLYQAQQQQQQQQQHQQQALPQPQPQIPPQQMSPDIRREPRVVGQPQPNPYAAQQPLSALPPAQQGQAGTPQQQSASFPLPYQLSSPSNRPGTQPAQGQPSGPTSAPRAPQGVLPRLNTGEMQVQPPPQNTGMQRGGTLHPLQQSHSVQSGQSQDATSSPLYFHHYVPPGSQPGSKDSKEAKEPSTPSGTSDYTTSPRKRKAQGGHQAQPPPSSQPAQASPFSQAGSTTSTPGRRPAHSRNRSDASTRTYESQGRGPNRPAGAEGGGQQPTPSSLPQGPSSASMSDVSGGSQQTPPQPPGGQYPASGSQQARRAYSAGPEAKPGRDPTPDRDRRASHEHSSGLSTKRNELGS